MSHSHFYGDYTQYTDHVENFTQFKILVITYTYLDATLTILSHSLLSDMQQLELTCLQQCSSGTSFQFIRIPYVI